MTIGDLRGYGFTAFVTFSVGAFAITVGDLFFGGFMFVITGVIGTGIIDECERHAMLARLRRK